MWLLSLFMTWGFLFKSCLWSFSDWKCTIYSWSLSNQTEEGSVNTILKISIVLDVKPWVNFWFCFDKFSNYLYLQPWWDFVLVFIPMCITDSSPRCLQYSALGPTTLTHHSQTLLYYSRCEMAQLNRMCGRVWSTYEKSGKFWCTHRVNF